MKKYKQSRKFFAVFLVAAGLGVSFILLFAFFSSFSSGAIPNRTFVGRVPVSGLSIDEARNALEQKKKENRATIRLGDKTVNVSYDELGIEVDTERALASIQPNLRFGMASLLPSGNEEQKFLPEATVNEKILKHAILAFFPVLADPEEAEPQFFITAAERQKRIPTFHLAKMARQLAYDASRLQNADIEIEILPYDDTEGPAITPEEIEAQKKTLSEKTLVLRAEDDDIAKLEWKVDLKQPGWLQETPAGVSVNKNLLRQYLIENVVERVQRPAQDVSIKNFLDEGKAAHAEVEGIARDGISVPLDENIERIQKSVSEGIFEITLAVERVPAFIYNETEIDFGNMELLAVGRSNFAGSPEGRKFNIQKGLREKFNNIIIPPGAEFSFNSFLGPVTNKAGWKNALGIFGGQLKPTPGAGLCQVSTTVYRAAVNAGLPMLKRRSHSLYVTYYKEYGEGLDATIFQGGQDLVFKNDTPFYILMQAYDDGDDAYVKIYGTPDGRTVALEGPYRTDNIPAEKKAKYGSAPRKNEIFWYRKITKPDGAQEEEQIVSRYRSLPK